MYSTNDKITISKRIFIYLFCLVTLLFALAPMTIQPYFSFDESFTVNLIRNSWGDLIRFTGLDVHPPLYYLAVKAVVLLLGESVFAFHLVSLVCYLLLLLVTALFFEKYFSQKAAALVVLGLCGAPNLLLFALQVRMYSMAMLWVAISFYLTYIIGEKYDEKIINKYWIGLALSNVAAAYTHYFAGLAAVMLSFFLLVYLLLLKKPWKRLVIQWGIYCIFMFVLYLPWLFVLLRQMAAISQDYWISKENLQLFTYIVMIFQMPDETITHLLMMVFFFSIFFTIWKWKGEKKQIWLAGGLAVAAGWFLLGMGYSLLKTPILVDRYLVVLLPVVWVSVVGGLVSLSNQKLNICLVLLFTLCFMQSAQQLKVDYNDSNDNELIAFLESHVQEEDAFLYINVQEMSTNMIYFPEKDHYILKGSDTTEIFKYWTEMTDCEMLEDLAEITQRQDTVWCLRGDWLEVFGSLGYQMETFEVGASTVFRFYK